MRLRAQQSKQGPSKVLSIVSAKTLSRTRARSTTQLSSRTQGTDAKDARIQNERKRSREANEKDMQSCRARGGNRRSALETAGCQRSRGSRSKERERTGVRGTELEDLWRGPWDGREKGCRVRSGASSIEAEHVPVDEDGVVSSGAKQASGARKRTSCFWRRKENEERQLCTFKRTGQS